LVCCLVHIDHVLIEGASASVVRQVTAGSTT
jgi:hypothetical protein